MNASTDDYIDEDDLCRNLPFEQTKIVISGGYRKRIPIDSTRINVLKQ